MNEYLQSPLFKSHLENAYYIAGILVGIIAVFAAFQYFLTRELAKQSARRESYSLAASKCEYFASVIIPLASQLEKEIESKGLLFLKHAAVEECETSIHVSMTDVTDEDIEALNHLDTPPVRVLNHLEAFALFFETRVAAELPGFLTVGAAYCDIVRDLLPFVALSSDDDPSFEHMMSLYQRWQSNRNTFKLLKKRAMLEIDIAKSNISIRKPFGC